MNKTLAELRVGTYTDICTVTEDTPIIEALRLFVEKRVSALPVVDSNTGLFVCLFVHLCMFVQPMTANKLTPLCVAVTA